MRIINEPTAAALAYGVSDTGKKVMVYDLGGGTFDVSILDIDDGVFEVLSTNGDTHLGGDDFDQAIINYLLDEFKKTEGVDLSTDKMAMQRLKEAAEKSKIELSTTTTSNINLPFITADATGPKHMDITLTKAKFDELTADLVARTLTCIRNAMNDAGLNASQIDEVLLVGGSSRIPAVQEAVKKEMGKEPNKGINPDECVAVGAARQAGVLGGEETAFFYLTLHRFHLVSKQWVVYLQSLSKEIQQSLQTNHKYSQLPQTVRLLLKYTFFKVKEKWLSTTRLWDVSI